MNKCPQCAGEIEAKVKKCKHCGSDLRGFAAKHPIITFLLVLFAIGMVGAAMNPPKEGERRGSSSGNTPQKKAAAKIDFTVSATDLVQAYKDNEVAADVKYKGKALKVTGIVTSIKKDITSEIYVTLKGTGFRSVQCYFEDSENSKVANLKKGDELTVIGDCHGLMMNVLMKECEIK